MKNDEDSIKIITTIIILVISFLLVRGLLGIYPSENTVPLDEYWEDVRG